MQKALITSMIILSSLTLAPKQANAGFVIGTVAGISNLDAPVIVGIIAGAVVGGAVDASMTAARGGNLLVGTFLGAAFGAVVGSVLDVDAALSTDAIAAGIKSKYSFLNNPESANDLAVMIKSKFHTAVLANPSAKSAFVRLSSTEVAQALAGSSVTVEQFQQIAADLN